MTDKARMKLLKLFDKIDAQIAAEKACGDRGNYPSLLKRIEKKLRGAARRKGLSIRVRARMVKLADRIKGMVAKGKAKA